MKKKIMSAIISIVIFGVFVVPSAFGKRFFADFSTEPDDSIWYVISDYWDDTRPHAGERALFGASYNGTDGLMQIRGGYVQSDTGLTADGVGFAQNDDYEITFAEAKILLPTDIPINTMAIGINITLENESVVSLVMDANDNKFDAAIEGLSCNNRAQSFSREVWYKLSIKLTGRKAIFKINNVIVCKEDMPLKGIRAEVWANSNPAFPVGYVDYFIVKAK
jgi:hypothetical protein